MHARYNFSESFQSLPYLSWIKRYCLSLPHHYCTNKCLILGGNMTPRQVEDRLKTAYNDSNISVVDLTGAQSYYEVNVDINRWWSLFVFFITVLFSVIIFLRIPKRKFYNNLNKYNKKIIFIFYIIFFISILNKFVLHLNLNDHFIYNMLGIMSLLSPLYYIIIFRVNFISINNKKLYIIINFILLVIILFILISIISYFLNYINNYSAYSYSIGPKMY